MIHALIILAWCLIATVLTKMNGMQDMLCVWHMLFGIYVGIMAHHIITTQDYQEEE